ncbi:MAG: hypothetical protein M3198_04190 [Actinomycetota bacterium]|nr:hypothetical protein [Actinomycetota bacterium]
MEMRWSVAIQTEGDEVMSVERIVELADSVAKHDGVASGVGQAAYGAKLIVVAGSRAEAEAIGTAQFRAAVEEAQLPEWPITRIDTISEEEEEAEDW